MTITFDTSLDAVADAVEATSGILSLEDGRILRDAKGQLSFVSSATRPGEDFAERAEQTIRTHLQGYERPDRPLIFADDPGALRLLADESVLPVRLDRGRTALLLDRRIAASGWLEKPANTNAAPPRVVFASLKGGVGRTTAMTIAAADLAQQGYNILVVDLDLEAPGVGEFLLQERNNPKFGVLDFLVDNAILGTSRRPAQEYVQGSFLTSGRGKVDVVPAFGSVGRQHPENVLAKLSRAFNERISEDGEVFSLSHQISRMLDSFTEGETYDFVFIDSRAGLAELSAPTLLGLGASVLLFGTAQKQTFQGYRALFGGLRLLAERDRANGETADWRQMFKPVIAKASMDSESVNRFRDNFYDLFADFLYDEAADPLETLEAFNFLPDDTDAPHFPLAIPFDPRLAEFEPSVFTNQLLAPFYESTYRPFIEGLLKFTRVRDEASGLGE